MENEELLSRAASEIRGLRNERKQMKARLDMFDDCMALLTARIERGGDGLMHPDIVYEIDKVIASAKIVKP